ncbi:MAG: hypothetical protein LBR47_06295 [Spirochaetaceae bacterium]|nr:hypothetical protein [Spirochaetaceae bacterium]
MKTKIWITALMICALLTVPVSLFAEEMLSANDLDPAASLTGKMTEGIFTLNASPSKSMKIEIMDVEMPAEDGEIFNARISTGGAGDAEARSISFTTTKAAAVTVYTLSSSKTDTRTLAVRDGAGKTIAELPSPPSPAGAEAKVAAFQVPGAGTYTITSKSGGVYIYAVIVK